jgi:hypothetical protein
MSESYVIAGPVFYAGLAGLVLVIGLLLLLVIALANASGRADRDAGVKGSPRVPSVAELDELERYGRHERVHPYVADLRRLSDVELASVGEDVITGMERLEGQGRATSSAYAQLVQQAGHVLDEQRRRRTRSHR